MNPTMRRALRHRPFRRLLAALAISQVGDWLYNVALLAAVYERTHSSAWLAVTTAARVLPVVLLSPFGGVLADRFDRRRIMVGSDVLRAALMIALWAVTAAGLPNALLPLLAATATAAAAPYAPCTTATIPRLLPADEVAGGNAARSAVGALSIVLGPAAGAVLLVVTTPAAAFLINAMSFAISAAVVAASAGRAAFAPAATHSGDRPRLLADVATGWQALRASAIALRLVGADVTCSVVYGAQTVLFVLVAHSFGDGDNGYGWLLAAVGGGGLAGTVIAPRAMRAGNRRPALAAALLAVAIPLPLIAVAPSLPVTMLLAAVIGAGSIVVEVLADTGLQQCLAPDVLGRAYGFAFPAAIGGIVLGSLIAGPLQAVLGLRGCFLVLGVGVAVHAALLIRPPRNAASLPDVAPIAQGEIHV